MERIWLARLHCNLQVGHPKERVVNTHTHAHTCSGVLHFVGLKPQKEERLHWDAVQQSIRENRLKQMNEDFLSIHDEYAVTHDRWAGEEGPSSCDIVVIGTM